MQILNSIVSLKLQISNLNWFFCLHLKWLFTSIVNFFLTRLDKIIFYSLKTWSISANADLVIRSWLACSAFSSFRSPYMSLISRISSFFRIYPDLVPVTVKNPDLVPVTVKNAKQLKTFRTFLPDFT